MDWLKIKGILACFAAISFWGLGLFGNNVKEYITRGSAKVKLEDDPSMMLMSAGMLASAVIYLIVWPQKPFVWITRRISGVSLITGLLYGIANVAYYLSASSGEKASILGPLSSVHILVPPAVGLLIGKPLTKKVALGFTCSIFTLIALSGLLPGSGGPKEPSTDAEMASPKRGLTGIQWMWMAVLIIGWGMGMVNQESMGRGVTKEQFPQAHCMFALGYSLVFWIFAFAWQTGIKEISNPANWATFGAPQIVMLITALFSGLGTGMFTYALQCWPNLNLMTALSSIYVVIPSALGMICLHEPPTYNVFLGLFFAVLGVIILAMEVNAEGKEPADVKIGEEEPLIAGSTRDLNIELHYSPSLNKERETYYGRLKRFFWPPPDSMGDDGEYHAPPTPISGNPIPIRFATRPSNEPNRYGATDTAKSLPDAKLEMTERSAAITPGDQEEGPSPTLFAEPGTGPKKRRYS